MTYEPSLYFFEFIHHKSVTQAAQALGISQPALSRYLKKVENAVGAKLYTYHDKEVTLTREGQLLARFLIERSMLEIDFMNQIKYRKNTPEGYLKVLVAPDIADTWLMPYLHDYLKAYPHIRMDLLKAYPIVEPFSYDVIFSTKIKDSRQKNLFLRRVSLKLFGSTSYLRDFGTPTSWEDIPQHRLIHMTDTTLFKKYILSDSIRTYLTQTPFLTVSSFEILKEAAERHMGLIVMNELFITKKTNLVSILEHQVQGFMDIYLSYPNKAILPQPLQSFIAFFKKIRSYS